jgi:hypothetical protein
VLAAAARCSAIADYRKWLDCYYGAAQPMRSLLGLAPATAEQQRLSAGVGTPPPPRGPGFGMTAALPGSPERKVPPAQFGLAEQDLPGYVDHISARMTAFTLDRTGGFTATLSNGQVWRQQSGDTPVRWDKPAQKKVYDVVIERGALGSFNFRVQGQPGNYKVTRLQ